MSNKVTKAEHPEMHMWRGAIDAAHATANEMLQKMYSMTDDPDDLAVLEEMRVNLENGYQATIQLTSAANTMYNTIEKNLSVMEALREEVQDLHDRVANRDNKAAKAMRKHVQEARRDAYNQGALDAYNGRFHR